LISLFGSVSIKNKKETVRLYFWSELNYLTDPQSYMLAGSGSQQEQGI